MAGKVLISGGTGMIGNRLTELLLNKGYEVAYLSRGKAAGTIPVFHWNIQTGEIDTKAIEFADYIIHLAGAGIADKRWTEKRKQEIVDSRVNGTNLLFQALQNNKHHVRAFISASAIHYYGDQGDKVLYETDPPADIFLGYTTKQWEDAVMQIESLKIRTVINRIGLVLSTKGGFLAELLKPMNFGVAGYFSTGNQYFSWIHIDDLCRMIIFELENDNVQGVYNAVSPEPVRNKEMVRQIKESLGRRVLLARAPFFALKVALGEMADSLVYSTRASSEKIRQEGFLFEFGDLKSAVKHLLQYKI